METFLKTLMQYDMDAICKVVQDRLNDYNEHVRDEYEGDEHDHCYPSGYGDHLEDALHIIQRLQELLKDKK